MLQVIRKLIFFRLGQKTTKGFAKSLGFKKLSPIVGLVGGFKMMKKHSH